MKKERFKFVKVGEQTYVFDKIIFRTTIIFSIFFFVFVWFISGSSLISQNLHLKCEVPPKNLQEIINPVGCKNPIYQEYQYVGKFNVPRELYDQEYLPFGYEINKPNIWVRIFPVCFFWFIIFGFVLNHLRNNKSFRFKEAFKVRFEIDN